MMVIIRIIANAVIGEPPLPDLPGKVCLVAAPVRKPAFYQLNRTLHRNLDVGCQNEMSVIRHDHEFMEKKFSLRSISKHSLQKQLRQAWGPEYRPSLMTDGEMKNVRSYTRRILHQRQSAACVRT